MSKLHRLRPVAVALLPAFLLSSCAGGTHRPFFRRHKQITGTPPVLQVATRDELNAIIARTYDAVHSFQATNVDLTASSGSVHQADIKDYPALSGIIIFRKPNGIRVQASLLGAKAFDMVSDGTSFRVFLRKGNLFFEGLNSAPATSANKMENLRPEAFLSSMLIPPWDRATESVMLKDDTDEDDALYRLEFNRKAKDGTPIPGREVLFDREDLSIVRQKVWDADGNIVSDTGYSKWQMFNGVPFPAHIDINRRIDGYGVAIELDKDKMQMNKDLTDEQFVLEQPEGSTRRVIE